MATRERREETVDLHLSICFEASLFGIPSCVLLPLLLLLLLLLFAVAWGTDLGVKGAPVKGRSVGSDEDEGEIKGDEIEEDDEGVTFFDSSSTKGTLNNGTLVGCEGSIIIYY